MKNSETLHEKSHRFAASAATHMVDCMLPAEIAPDTKAAVERLAAYAYTLHLAGDEQPTSDYGKSLKLFIDYSRQASPMLANFYGHIARYLAEDVLPHDNDETIEF